MLDIAKDIHSLSDFKRRTSAYLRRMKRTGHPLVLTINGRAELVVHDADSYQKLVEALDRIEAIEGIRKGLESKKRGEGRPATEALDELRRKYKIAKEA